MSKPSSLSSGSDPNDPDPGDSALLTAIKSANKEYKGVADKTYQATTSVQLPDLNRELGFAMTKVQDDRRLEAMTNPAEYNAARNKAYAEMEEQIQGAYLSNFNQYMKAGYTEADSKQRALGVAKVVKETQLQAIRTEFGDDSNTISAAKQIQTAQAAQSGLTIKSH
jgi:hypothetical protein